MSCPTAPSKPAASRASSWSATAATGTLVSSALDDDKAVLAKRPSPAPFRKRADRVTPQAQRLIGGSALCRQIVGGRPGRGRPMMPSAINSACVRFVDQDAQPCRLVVWRHSDTSLCMMPMHGRHGGGWRASAAYDDLVRARRQGGVQFVGAELVHQEPTVPRWHSIERFARAHVADAGSAASTRRRRRHPLLRHRLSKCRSLHHAGASACLGFGAGGNNKAIRSYPLGRGPLNSLESHT